MSRRCTRTRPAVIDGLERKENPDRVCEQVKVCTSNGQCALHAPVGSAERERYWGEFVAGQRAGGGSVSREGVRLQVNEAEEQQAEEREGQTPWGE